MSWIKSLSAGFKKDEELVKLWIEGEDWAFDEIYSRYVKRVYNFCFARLGQLDATEATQEIFYKLVRGRASFKSDSVFSVWFWTIVRNQVNDLIRTRYQAQFEELSEEVVSEISEDEVEKLLKKEESTKVQKAFSQLVQVEQEVMGLWLQDLSYDEMKEVLGISLDAIKGRLKRARAHLYENLKDEL